MINKVFGIGLSRTGTTSLNTALCTLGIKSIHFPNDVQTYHELMEAKYDLTVLKSYQGITDTPVVPIYPQLDKAYPGSKFILTVRDKEAWLDSVERHWAKSGWVRGNPGLYTVTAYGYWAFNRISVYGCVVFDRARFSYVYDVHHRNVRHYFADRRQDLLVLDICGGDGWGPLCKFLDKRVPDVRFPHDNGRSEMTDFMTR
jgi:hypothetical protein